MKAQITERRQQLAAYQTKRVGLTKLFRRCANEETTQGSSLKSYPCTGAAKGSGANSKNSTPCGGVKEVRVASFPPFLHIES
ncbi:hypothetical protein BDD14_0043 [Edaphobacter modestus]|uniref:Uncharacterized protein n=1 Tax=Edaphobacter modestus TaxID=388466 RepID=A0A4Q7YPI8_9BACT|nr:hypothetical protein BDD14_0043 [Edaphobacter modestus]